MVPEPKKATPEEWQACREAVALGLTIKDAAKRYGLSYEAAKKQAQTHGWPTPARLPKPSPVPAAAQMVGDDWQARGERLRNRLFDLSLAALNSATPSKLTRWDDIERAARVGERAAGLEKVQMNSIQIAFPDVLSSEVPGYISVSATEPPKRPGAFVIRDAAALDD